MAPARTGGWTLRARWSNMALVGSRRDTAKEQTRRALLASALRMFSEQGLDGPSLDAICEDAGYTRGAFYVHFKNREALIVAVVSDVIGVFVDTVVQAGDGHDLVRSVRSYTTLYRLATEGNDVVSSTTGTVLSASIALKKMHVVLEACERSPAVRQTFAQLLWKFRSWCGRHAIAQAH